MYISVCLIQVYTCMYMYIHVYLCVYTQGLECLCHSGECMFLVLLSAQERNRLYECILTQPKVSLNQDSLEDATLKWLEGEMSNYQYLMLLNL